ncbi:hypothetical protein KQY30_24990 [Streptomyces sp. GMY02]|uniref:hypothetical protein n=1 Tax=Streptomyces sp. GMY02 TaxID=1333528 RepID=UPI001C2C6057|nr:hypothetical protein [Streptomyces sp. GMY02]QXE36982.1 hypothetical protein KQY30_24990 [Streptomyces sp. GMY02]
MTFSPRTWTVGEIVTDVMLNEQIRDQFNSMFDAWTAYTPAWTAATTNPVLGNGSINGRYMKIGRTCHVNIELTMGSTTTYGSGIWNFALPFTAAAAVGSRIGNAQAAIPAGSRVPGQTVVTAGGSTFSTFFPASTSVSFLSSGSAPVPFTWASTHQLRASLVYETAA